MDPIAPVIEGAVHVTYRGDGCRDLPAVIVSTDLGDCTLTRWRPTAEDLARLLDGGDVFLWVWTGGAKLQPVALSTEPGNAVAHVPNDRSRDLEGSDPDALGVPPASASLAFRREDVVGKIGPANCEICGRQEDRIEGVRCDAHATLAESRDGAGAVWVDERGDTSGAIAANRPIGIRGFRARRADIVGGVTGPDRTLFLPNTRVADLTVAATSGRVVRLSCAHQFRLGDLAAVPDVGVPAYCPICSPAREKGSR